MGQTDLSTPDAVFATEVAVTSQNTGLRIGMNARLNYILDRAEQIREDVSREYAARGKDQRRKTKKQEHETR